MVVSFLFCNVAEKKIMAKVNVHYFQMSITHYGSMTAIKVRQKYGWNGYGLYVAIMQMLASAPNHKLSLTEIPQIVYQLRLNVEDESIKMITGIVHTCFQITPENDFYSLEVNESVSSLMKRVSNLNPSAAGKASAEARKTKKLLDAVNRGIDTPDTGDTEDKEDLKDTGDKEEI